MPVVGEMWSRLDMKWKWIHFNLRGGGILGYDKYVYTWPLSEHQYFTIYIASSQHTILAYI